MPGKDDVGQPEAAGLCPEIGFERSRARDDDAARGVPGRIEENVQTLVTAQPSDEQKEAFTVPGTHGVDAMLRRGRVRGRIEADGHDVDVVFESGQHVRGGEVIG